MSKETYDVVETVHAGRRTTARRVAQRGVEQTYLLRSPNSGNAQDRSALDEEMAVLELLGRECRQVGAGDLGPDCPAGVLTPDVGGQLLGELIPEGGMPPQQALWIAAGLVGQIQQLHEQRIVHKGVATPSVLVNSETREVDIICLCLTSRLPRQTGQLVHPGRLEGDLSYISPEQTGRMNRAVDYRTDFYSLGVTLYEMFTGKLPFSGDDPAELVHAHIARPPSPPAEQGVPPVLAEMLLRLLAKNAEDRYQSCAGILDDLQTCAKNLEQDGQEGDFELGRSDHLGRVQVPQKLYGREAERGALLAAFEEVSAGAAELVLVSGYSGVGKTSLVQEIHRPITRREGLFIAGKYDQFKQNVPHHALAAAFRDLIRQLLTESSESVRRWREKLTVALGENAQILIDLVPELELIIGPQAPVKALSPGQSEIRFNTTFSHFIRVFAGAERPLVVFLDDMQWVDAASLKLVRYLTTSATGLRLLFVAAYRDNEVNAAHPLMVAIDELRKEEVTIRDIVLKPLPRESVQQLVSDTLRCEADQAAPLTELLLGKTGGNPFFLIQFIETLDAEDYLRFDPQQRIWIWDTAEISAMESTENVVDLMVSRLRKLPAGTRELLKLASCIGSTFDLGTLSTITERPVVEVAGAAWEALQRGLLIPLTGAGAPGQVSPAAISLSPERSRFRFLHDRVQQAANTMISEQQRKPVHLKIGRLIRHNTLEDGLEERAFDIVSHLGQCVELIDDEQERLDLARICLMAGDRAKSATAFGAARNYMQTGVKLMGDAGWSTDYDLTKKLHFGLAECSYLSGQLEQAEAHFEQILGKAKTNAEKARLYKVRANLAVYEVKNAEALAHLVAGLALLGTEIPRHEDAEKLMEVVGAESAALEPLLQDKNIAELVDLPEMTEVDRLVECELLQELSIAGMHFSPLLVQIAVIRLVRLSLEFGNCPASAPAYASYGMTIGSAAGQYAAGHTFGTMSIKLAKRQQDPLAELVSRFWFCAMNSHWRAPIDESIEVGKLGVEIGQRIGAPLWTAYTAFFVPVHLSFAGAPVAEVIEELERHMLLQDPHAAAGNAPYVQLYEALRGNTRSLTGFDEEGWDDDHVEQMKAGSMLMALQHYFLTRMWANVLWGRAAEALATADKAAAEGDILAVLFGQLATARFVFYHALAIADALREELPDLDREALRETLEARRGLLATWAESCPENFGAMFRLVEAEHAALEGDQLSAMAHFDAAIRAAAENGLLQHHAQACERATRFHRSHDNAEIGSHFFQLARDSYQRWGATAKAAALVRQAPELFDAAAGASADTSLDMLSVLKAARMVSGEIEYDKLLTQGLELLMENSGAQRGVLLLSRDGELQVEGAADVEGPGQASPDHAGSIVDYCRRTNEQVLLGDAGSDRMFRADPHIATTRPKSVLAMPLTRKGQVTGVLYLENRISAGAFTPGRVQVLEALCAQLVVSIENSLVYRNLEHLVQQRTAQLAEAKEAAEHANQVKSAFLASMSHELRTPLNAILGYSELLKEELIDEELDDFTPDLDKINWSGRHLLSLINDILDLSKIEAGKIELYLEEFSISDVVGQIVSSVKPLVSKNANKLVVDCPDDIGEMYADQTRVRQVLFNLISNSTKFTEKGSITLRLRRSEGSGQVLFEVRDTGIGMTPDQLAKIFEPFRQADASTTKKFGGTGLGLTISQRFCELMGGSIRAESEAGQGTSFKVVLPEQVGEDARADTVDLPAPGAEADSEATEADSGEQGAGVLVIDDDPAVLELLQRSLKKNGFEVRCASSGAEGLRLARERRPSAITLDVMMPGMDGWSVLTELKADPELADIPVIMLSIVEDRERGFTLGATEYLTKPVDRDRLIRCLSRHLADTSREVLVVEDSEGDREMLRRILEKEGYTVCEAENGKVGMQMALERRPRLVLSDLIMPEMDGFQFVHALRHDERTSKIPVIVVTAKDLTPELRQRLNDHVQVTMQKGVFSREELLGEVRRLLDQMTRNH